MLRLRPFLALSVLLTASLAAGCGDDDGPADTGVADTGAGDSGGSDDAGGGTDAGGGADAATDAGGGADAATDAGGGTDAGDDAGSGTDAGGGTDAGSGTDAGGDTDTGPACGGNTPGFCTERGTMCLSCPIGGPLNNYLCTTRCNSSRDCTSPDRPVCNQMNPRTEGICTPAEFRCNWGAICAAPDTPIATPDGDRPIAELAVGDLVYSVDHGQIVAVPVARTGRAAAHDHHVMEVTLANGEVLAISGGHPTAEGGYFTDLRAGDRLGEVEVVSVREVPYPHAYTYDILPASETGTYFAGGALIGSTLAD